MQQNSTEFILLKITFERHSKHFELIKPIELSVNNTCMDISQDVPCQDSVI